MVRKVALVALSTLSVAFVAASVGVVAPSAEAGAAVTAPFWQTSETSPPLTNVAAVSCAPSSSPTAATCVAVGDDGSSYASAIVSQNGGTTWTSSALPTGVTTLTAVSCPSSAICYAGGGSGILKSTNGGSTWAVQDAAFPAQSISCFTTIECTAVEGIKIAETSNGSSWTAQVPPTGTDGLFSVSCPNAITCAAVGDVGGLPAIIGTTNGGTWSTIGHPSVSYLALISCAGATNCVVVGVASGGQGTSLTTTDFSNWATTSSIPAGSQLNAITCVNITTCTAVGTNLNTTSYVIGTSNNGQTWSSQTVPANAVDVTGISCSAPGACVAVGNTGNLGAGSTIMSTTTGGLSWSASRHPLERVASGACPARPPRRVSRRAWARS